MALTQLQRTVCQLLAANRIASGESYVAGDVALNELIGASRISRDVDVFHDTDEALAATWSADRTLLEASGFEVVIVRERPTLVEAEVRGAGASVRLEWARDSAFRFFPLKSHEELGLTLHPFDFATNKVLALVGRLEVHDWIDVIATDQRLQPLGYLCWAACGKDPGFGPASILEWASRTGRYTQDEVDELMFDGEAPNAALLGQKWHHMLESAHEIIATLPPEEIGACVLDDAGQLLQESPAELVSAIRARPVNFHHGKLHGAFPQLMGSSQAIQNP